MPLQKKRRLLRRTIELPATEITQPPAAMHNLEFVITNIGRATARELLVNYIFNGLTAQQLAVARGAPPMQGHPLQGEPLWVIHIDHIHPGDSDFFQVLTTQVPIATQSIEIGYEVSMADAPARHGTLRVKFGPTITESARSAKPKRWAGTNLSLSAERFPRWMRKMCLGLDARLPAMSDPS